MDAMARLTGVRDVPMVLIAIVDVIVTALIVFLVIMFRMSVLRARAMFDDASMIARRLPILLMRRRPSLLLMLHAFASLVQLHLICAIRTYVICVRAVVADVTVFSFVVLALS